MLIKKLTKKEAEKAFRENFPSIIKSGDKPLKRMVWNDYTDALCKNGEITQMQCSTWTQPKFISK